ncbi:MAG: chromosome partitioning protein ParB [Spirochaetaceae bacterium]|nr:MAG: chromosome partitioning protein ParB [Spirochaetaceae bacterium]
MQVEINSIIIRKRIRKSLGDIGPLMRSIESFGLMNPIVINGKNELIAGHRRLEAVRRLGWSSVPVRVVDRDDDAEKLEMELDENIHRKELTTDELAEAYMKLDKMKNPGFFKKILAAIRAFFRKIFRRRIRRKKKTRPKPA